MLSHISPECRCIGHAAAWPWGWWDFSGVGLYSVFFFFKEACFFLGGSKLGYLKEMADVGIGQVDFFFLEYSGV